MSVFTEIFNSHEVDLSVDIIGKNTYKDTEFHTNHEETKFKIIT